jgi:hypothetical protein
MWFVVACNDDDYDRTKPALDIIRVDITIDSVVTTDIIGKTIKVPSNFDHLVFSVQLKNEVYVKYQTIQMVNESNIEFYKQTTEFPKPLPPNANWTVGFHIYRHGATYSGTDTVNLWVTSTGGRDSPYDVD